MRIAKSIDSDVFDILLLYVASKCTQNRPTTSNVVAGGGTNWQTNGTIIRAARIHTSAIMSATRRGLASRPSQPQGLPIIRRV